MLIPLRCDSSRAEIGGCQLEGNSIVRMRFIYTDGDSSGFIDFYSAVDKEHYSIDVVNSDTDVEALNEDIPKCDNCFHYVNQCDNSGIYGGRYEKFFCL